MCSHTYTDSDRSGVTVTVLRQTSCVKCSASTGKREESTHIDTCTFPPAKAAPQQRDATDHRPVQPSRAHQGAKNLGHNVLSLLDSYDYLLVDMVKGGGRPAENNYSWGEKRKEKKKADALKSSSWHKSDRQRDLEIFSSPVMLMS